ncbi:MAG: PGF-CTERM sorting domain-containing protein [Haloferacaceae archaeon]
MSGAVTARTWLVVAGAVMLVVGASAPATASHPEPALVVDLEEDGSATVTLRLTYDLTTDAERSAFEDLRNSESTRREALTRYRERMSRVANASENETGRSMSVSGGSVDLTRTDDDVGVVRLSVEWEGLAATRDGRLVVTTPFDDGYDPDRRLVVTGPEGYEVADVSPEPASREGTTLRWDAETSLEGFSVTYAPSADGGTATGGTDTPTPTPAGDGGGSGGSAPGFGVAAAIAALLAAGVALIRRR